MKGTRGRSRYCGGLDGLDIDIEAVCCREIRFKIIILICVHQKTCELLLFYFSVVTSSFFSPAMDLALSLSSAPPATDPVQDPSAAAAASSVSSVPPATDLDLDPSARNPDLFDSSILSLATPSSPSSRAPPSDPVKKRRNTGQFTDAEVIALTRGVAKYGESWFSILEDQELFKYLSKRTNIDLKDKWRNIKKSKKKNLIDFLTLKVEDSYDSLRGLEYVINDMKKFVQLPLKRRLFSSESPKALLLHGPSGTGKTLLARATAHHTGCNLITVASSQDLDDPQSVRIVFHLARQGSPSIIFFDAVDSIHSEPIILEILKEVNLLENVKVLMATNLIDGVDDRLKDSDIKKLAITLPNDETLYAILTMHIMKMDALTHAVDLKVVASMMASTSGAKVKDVCDQVDMILMQEQRAEASLADFEVALNAVLKKDA